MSKTKKPKIEAKFFPFAVRQPLWEMAKKYGRQKYAIVAIWDYMWWRSGKGGLFELAEDIVCWDLDCDPTTLRAVRKILIAEGWLRKETLRDKGGKWMTRGFTVIAKGATVPKSLGGEEQPPSHEPAVAEPTVDSTSSGGTPHTVLVHELDANASTPNCLPSEGTSSGFIVSELVSESQASDFVENKNQNLFGLNLSSEEPTQNQKQPQEPVTLTPEAQAICDILYPVGITGDYYAVMAKLNAVAEYNYSLEYLKWNRGHKSGALYIRTPEQLEKAMLSGYGVTDMVAHKETKADKCPVCIAETKKAEDEKAAKTPCVHCGKMGAKWDWFDQCAECWNEANRLSRAEIEQEKARSKTGWTPPQPKGNPNCSRCKGSTYANPTYEDGEPFCGDCMKLPKYRRHSRADEIIGKGEIGSMEAVMAQNRAKAAGAKPGSIAAAFQDVLGSLNAPAGFGDEEA